MILDGGLSNALSARGHDLSGHLWTASLLRDAPGEIAAVHRTYYEAGAEVATTASYQASVEGFAHAGVSRPEAEALICRSVTLARGVRDELGRDGRRRLVAASVGPYGAVLADGSEYRGRYGVTSARLRDFHLPRIELLASAEPDLLAVETIPDAEEAAILVEILDDVGLPAWLSYSVLGTCTRAGQPLEGAFAVVADSPAVVATGVNCCRPDDVLHAVEVAGDVTGKPGVAYPNAGQGWESRSHSWKGPTSYDVTLAPRWVRAGAAYVGGCCQVGPPDIEALARALELSERPPEGVSPDGVA
ncbi:homocysteine S-methyltransferase [soil metagenome]